VLNFHTKCGVQPGTSAGAVPSGDCRSVRCSPGDADGLIGRLIKHGRLCRIARNYVVLATDDELKAHQQEVLKATQVDLALAGCAIIKLNRDYANNSRIPAK